MKPDVPQLSLYRKEWDVDGKPLEVFREFTQAGDTAWVRTKSFASTLEYFAWLRTFVPHGIEDNDIKVVQFSRGNNWANVRVNNMHRTHGLLFRTHGAIYTGWSQFTLPETL